PWRVSTPIRCEARFLPRKIPGRTWLANVEDCLGRSRGTAAANSRRSSQSVAEFNCSVLHSNLKHNKMGFPIDPKQMQMGERPHLSGSSLQPSMQQRSKLPRHKQGEHFLRGPIPLKWLTMASSLPGKALHVALAIWYGSGLRKSAMVPLSRK